jgi:CPA2 family monovalent cation:H+ antiporter-2
MPEHFNFGVAQEVLIVLGAMIVVIPLFHRIKFSPVLGFLLIGMVLGPTGFGGFIRTIPGLDWIEVSDSERIKELAEFGVIFLMFMIGLELSFERIFTMRRLVFGLGPLQLLLSAGAVAAILMLLGEARDPAIIIGLALALSSTAVVIQVLSEEKRLNTTVGRASFALLLFQDIAVVPILFGVTMIGFAARGAEGEGGNLTAFVLALGQAALAVAAVIAAGRLLLRPLFRSVARTNSPELFMAACLLVVFGASLATGAAGLSMAMGALLAGLLLAETEYRRQIEVLIDPFKGLLLGVFLISMGMSINLFTIAAQPLVVFGAALGLIAIKAALTYGLARAFKIANRPAMQIGLLLGPGGEFSFVVLGAATTLGVIGGPNAEIALIAAAVTMASTPVLSALGRQLGKRMATPPKPVDPALLQPFDLEDAPRVIIVGYGRVGQVVAEMLKAHDVEFIAVDSDVDVVTKARQDGARVYFGDATNPLFLERTGLRTARALVVTMDAGPQVEEVVSAARKEREDLAIVVRARDARHAAKLYAKGATDAVPETVESSLLLSETLLVDIGVPMGPVIASIHDRRAQFRAEIQQLAPDAEIRPSGRRRLRDHVRAKGS